MADPVTDSSARADRPHDTDQAQTYRKLLRAFFDSVGADMGALVARDGAAGPRILSMWERDHIPVPWVPEASILDRAFESEGVVVHPPLAPAAENGDGTGAVQILAAPVRAPQGVIGALYAGFEEPPSVEIEKLRWLVESYAGFAALCMLDGNGLTDVVGSATRDALTGCLNYGATMDVLSAEFARAQRRGHSLSCAFVDLDGFKGINDRLGHLQGNRVLAATGEALRSDARPYDSVGRFGGDEFVVILPETGGDGARVVAERLRGKIITAIADLTDVSLGVSFGVADWSNEESAEELLGTADHALGEAKGAGGSRVAVGGSSRTMDEPPPRPTEIFGKFSSRRGPRGDGNLW